MPVLMQHASRLCPDAALLYAWASRDVGMDCGAARYRDGEILEQICPRPASRQAYELSFDILGEPPEAFGLRYDPDAGTYVYEAEQKQKKENGEYGLSLIHIFITKENGKWKRPGKWMCICT